MPINDLLNHEEKLNRRKIKLVNIISFFSGFSQAILAYILSSYFKQVLGMEKIGLIFSITYLIIFLLLINLHKIVRRFGKSDSYFTFLTIQIIALFILAFSPASAWSALFLAVYIIFSNLSVVSMDFILESFSVDRMSGRLRGMYLTLLDAGFILGPLISTSSLEKFNFRGVFLIALIFYIIILLMALSGLRGINHKFLGRMDIMDIIKKIWKRKNVMRIYYVSFILESFYAIMIIFTPIYLRELGMDWQQIGLIFTVMLIPFIILPYPCGWLADTKYGEKEMLFGACFIMGFATLAIYFIGPATLTTWAIILLMTRIGASVIQTLRDSYFYKRIDAYDVDIIDFFRTAVPLGYVFSMIASTILLLFLPLNYIFIFLALLTFTALYPIFKMEDSR